MFKQLLGQISPIAFKLFGWPVHWYGVIIGLGMLIGYLMVGKEAQKNKIDSEKMSDLVFWSIIFGFIGARIYYVLFRLDYYIANPTHIFSIWEGGIAIYGGVLAGIGTIYYLCKKYRLPFIKVLDIVAPAILLAQAIGRWGNFINQEAYGYEVSKDYLNSLHLPQWIINQMNINGYFHHPTFLYESVWNFIGVLLLLVMRRLPNTLKEGEIAAGYLLWYGLGRMVIEGLRTDSLYFGPLRVSQWLAGFFVIFSLIFLAYRRKNSSIPFYSENQV